MFGEIYTSGIALVVMFNLTNKMSALYIWTSYTVVVYLNGLFKSVYAEPRPFWLSDEIVPSTCRPDFGNPSGHCMANSFIWVTLYLHKYYEVG